MIIFPRIRSQRSGTGSMKLRSYSLTLHFLKSRKSEILRDLEVALLVCSLSMTFVTLRTQAILERSCLSTVASKSWLCQMTISRLILSKWSALWEMGVKFTKMLLCWPSRTKPKSWWVLTEFSQGDCLFAELLVTLRLKLRDFSVTLKWWLRSLTFANLKFSLKSTTLFCWAATAFLTSLMIKTVCTQCGSPRSPKATITNRCKWC